MGKEILINQLFAGSYLDVDENVGHEIIDMFEADDGKNYLYVTPSGVVSESHDIEAVFFVRNVQSRRTAEVIAVATGVSRLSQEELDNLNSITYGHVALPQIFRGNNWKSEQDFYTNVTFVADEVKLPKQGERILLTLEDAQSEDCMYVHLDSKQKVLFNQGMRGYYSEDNNGLAYTQLCDLLADDCWMADSSDVRKLVTDESSASQSPSFLEVIKKDSDELVFSNLLAYFFDYSHVAFRAFAKECLGIPNMSASYSVRREHNHIDIFIESDNHVIVIENKINSGINGKKDGKTQLDQYWLKTENEVKGASTHYYLLVPNYAQGELLSIAGRNEFRDVAYEVIRYSQVYEFFIKNSSTYIADRCFPDFLRGLKRHTVASVAELNLDTMRMRFLNRIRHSIS